MSLPESPSDKTARFLFTGDLSITGVFRQRLSDGHEILSPEIRTLVAEHDFGVTNLEGPATSQPNAFRPDVYVVSPPASIAYLVERGLGVFNLANNHIFDCGVPGFSDTVAAISAAQARHFGAGANFDEASQPLIVHAGGLSLALIGVCRNHRGWVAAADQHGLFADTDPRQLRAAIRTAKERADWVVLNYHGGEEYTTLPMPSRRRRLLEYASWGADLVVGHHSHTTQGHELLGNAQLFYSLGNFVFDLEDHHLRQFTDVSALLSVTFGKHRCDAELIPIRIDHRQGMVVPGEPAFSDHLRRISNFSDYKRLWREDAYRVVFGRRRASTHSSTSGQPAAPARSRLRRLITPAWYRAQWKRWRSPNVRPILLAAIAEAVRRKLSPAAGNRVEPSPPTR